MKTQICLAGATGWVGQALVHAIDKSDDLNLAAAISRTSAGQRIHAAVPGATCDLKLRKTLSEALRNDEFDVLIDYTLPDAILQHTMQAIDAGISVIMGASGPTLSDYDKIDKAAIKAGVGCVAGNFSLTAALMMHLAKIAAGKLPQWEIIDYAGAYKPDSPSGTAYELAERIGQHHHSQDGLPVADTYGLAESRGASVDGSRIHSVRMNGFSSSCEIIFGLENERLSIRHDAGSTPKPYIDGTLFAARRVPEIIGLVRGLDELLF